MKKTVSLLLLLTIFSLIFAAEEDLPDIEITGPSQLKSILEKKGLSGNYLRIPDITDSLPPLLPPIPAEKTVVPLPKRHWLYAKATSNWDYQTCFLADSVLSLPLFSLIELQRSSLKNDWRQVIGGLDIGQETGYLSWSAGFNTVNSSSDFILDYQSVNTLFLNLNFSQLKLFSSPAKLYLKGELQNNRFQYINETDESDLYHYNHQIGLKGKLSQGAEYFIDGYYSYHTPALAIGFNFPERESPEAFDFVKSLAFYLTDNKVCPAVNLSQRFFLPANNTLHLYQKAEISVRDNYDLLLSQPWQKQRSDVFFTFQPVNAHLVWGKRFGLRNNAPLDFYLDIGLNYRMDDAVYWLEKAEDSLPIAKPQDVLEGLASLQVTYTTGSTKFSQEVAIRKDYKDGFNDEELPYIPLVTLKTDFMHSWQDWRLIASFNQYYRTQDDLDNFLEEALELNGRLEYALQKDLIVCIEMNNLLSKSKTIFRTLPQEPATIGLSIHYGF